MMSNDDIKWLQDRAEKARIDTCNLFKRTARNQKELEDALRMERISAQISAENKRLDKKLDKKLKELSDSTQQNEEMIKKLKELYDSI